MLGACDTACAFAIKPQQPGPPDFFQGNGSDIARRGPVATPRGVADSFVLRDRR
jgi:hypothetical protein